MAFGDFFQQVYQGTGLGNYVKGWNHASKIFVDGNYRLAPKMGFLFHVAFDINPAITRLPATEILEAGMLVKTMQLPKYTIDTKTLNAYNRPNIVQNKIKYDPVTITFHDDSSDVIRDLWYDYMSYYYRDSDYTPEKYLQATKYNAIQTADWGFTPSTFTRSNTGADRLLQRIRMYSLHQRQFTEYVLINPTITAFQHGQHQNSGDAGTMEHTMTVSYETVLYNYGTIESGQDTDFAQLHYDSTPSPLGIPSLAGSLVDSLTGGAGLGGTLGTIVGGLTGTQPKTGDVQLPGGRIPFTGTGAGANSGIGGLLNQIALGISKGNNPLKNLTVPTVVGAVEQSLGGGAGIIGLLGGGNSGSAGSSPYYLQGTDPSQIPSIDSQFSAPGAANFNFGGGASSNGLSIAGYGNPLGSTLNSITGLAGGAINSAINGGINAASGFISTGISQAQDLIASGATEVGSLASSAADSIQSAFSPVADSGDAPTGDWSI